MVDPGEVIRRAYGWKTQGMALIRPDGYLGLVADSVDAAILRDYLAETLRLAQPTKV